QINLKELNQTFKLKKIVNSANRSSKKFLHTRTKKITIPIKKKETRITLRSNVHCVVLLLEQPNNSSVIILKKRIT
ncbi:hypothetical protein HN51_029437, partial [Arachis hypogaea]